MLHLAQLPALPRLLAALALVLAGGTARALSITDDLGTFAGGTTSVANDISAAGVVVGYSNGAPGGQTHAASWTGGAIQDLGALSGGTFSQALGINGSSIAGESFTSSSGSSGVAVQWASPSATAPTQLSGVVGQSHAWDVNASGTMVGATKVGNPTVAFMRTSGGTVTSLGTLGGQGSVAYAINSSGTIVGYSDLSSGGSKAYIYSGGVMTPLDIWGSTNSSAIDINDAGDIVGFAYDASFHAQGFIRYADGTLINLGNLGTDQITLAEGINASRQVVGTSITADGKVHAFIWQGGVMTDLGTLGGDQSNAFAINDAGQVVGQSNLTNLGPVHAFLIDGNAALNGAVPEPGLLALAGLSLVAGAARRRFRRA